MFVTDILSKWTDRDTAKNSLRQKEKTICIPEFEIVPQIPRNLFQICLRGKPSKAIDVISALPRDFQNNIQSLKERNPEFEYQLFSDDEAESFILGCYGEKMLALFNRIDPHYLAAKADFLRYLLLYAKGGVYLDLKSTIVNKITDCLYPDDQFLVFYWDNQPLGQRHCLIPDFIPKGEMLQSFIISTKGHPFLREVIFQVIQKIDHYNPYKDGVGWTGVLQTTGPVVFTETIFRLTQSASECNASFREELPFKKFGFEFSFSGKYSPGQYQKRLSLRDYRTCFRPIIQSKNRFLQCTNRFWLSILHYYRILILRRS